MNDDNVRYEKLFSSTKETFVTKLGKTYIQNFLNNGGLRKGFSVVSNKRVYFQGTMFDVVYNNFGRKRIKKTNRSRIVDLQDITGTGFDQKQNVLLIILAFILFIISVIYFGADFYVTMRDLSLYVSDLGSVFGILINWILYLIPAAIGWLLFVKSKRNFITIQFAGGEVAFDTKWFSKEEIESFQKELRLAKDQAIEDSQNAIANKLTEALSVNDANINTQKNAQTNNQEDGVSGESDVIMHEASTNNIQVNKLGKADELLKYAQLLEKGLISQEEFDKVKKELL